MNKENDNTQKIAFTLTKDESSKKKSGFAFGFFKYNIISYDVKYCIL